MTAKTWLLAMVIGWGWMAGGWAFSLESTAFANRQPMPKKYTMTGENLSPALTWGKAPAGTQSLVLVCTDHHKIARHWVHWLVINIPPEFTGLSEGASRRQLPEGAVELFNSFDNEGYGGPFPPVGSGVHEYYFTVYALNVKQVDLPQGRIVSEKFLLQKLDGKIIEQQELIGTYER